MSRDGRHAGMAGFDLTGHTPFPSPTARGMATRWRCSVDYGRSLSTTGRPTGPRSPDCVIVHGKGFFVYTAITLSKEHDMNPRRTWLLVTGLLLVGGLAGCGEQQEPAIEDPAIATA